MLHKNGKSCIEQFIRQCQCYFECGTSGHKGKGSKRKKPDRSGKDLISLVGYNQRSAILVTMSCTYESCNNMESICKSNFKTCLNCKVGFYYSKNVKLILGMATRTYARPLTNWSNNSLPTYQNKPLSTPNSQKRRKVI